MASTEAQPIVLFCYPGSPFGLKVSTYLDVRKIPYSECHQPVIWPRPDIQDLSLNYRRIPILAIGKDIYCDTTLMFEKLEHLFPNRRLSQSAGSGKAQEWLLEQWSQGALMKSAGALLPSTMPLLADQAFLADRKKLWGIDFSPRAIEQMRPNALVDLDLHLNVIDGLVSDGRQWLSGSDDMGLADIHVGFFFNWLAMVPGALPEDFKTASEHSAARQYLQRYLDRAASAREQAGHVAVLGGAEAIELIRQAGFAEPEGAVVDAHTRFSKGQKVAVFRTDDISGHKDVGALLALSAQESIIAAGKEGELRLHCPRLNFAIAAAE